jgi:hypothetical protein
VFPRANQLVPINYYNLPQRLLPTSKPLFIAGMVRDILQLCRLPRLQANPTPTPIGEIIRIPAQPTSSSGLQSLAIPPYHALRPDGSALGSWVPVINKSLFSCRSSPANSKACTYARQWLYQIALARFSLPPLCVAIIKFEKIIHAMEVCDAY